MNRTEKVRLQKALSSYFEDIHKIYLDGNFREESFYPTLKGLLEECSVLFPDLTATNVLVLPKKTEVGTPDFLIGKNAEVSEGEKEKGPKTFS